MFNRSHVLQSLLINKRGNVAMIFALALVPMLLVAGFAIDAQLAFSKKDKIQHSIDSAVLAGARKKNMLEVVFCLIREFICWIW